MMMRVGVGVEKLWPGGSVTVLENCGRASGQWCRKTMTRWVGDGVEKLRPGGSVMVQENHDPAGGQWC